MYLYCFYTLLHGRYLDWGKPEPQNLKCGRNIHVSKMHHFEVLCLSMHRVSKIRAKQGTRMETKRKPWHVLW